MRNKHLLSSEQQNYLDLILSDRQYFYNQDNRYIVIAKSILADNEYKVYLKSDMIINPFDYYPIEIISL